MWYFLYPQDPESVQLFLVAPTGSRGIDTRDVQAAVAQKVCQSGDVFCRLVVDSCKKMAEVGKIFSSDTPACFFKAFISLQRLLRFFGLPLLVMNTEPWPIPFFLQYCRSFFRMSPPRRILRYFPLLKISILPFLMFSTVK